MTRRGPSCSAEPGVDIDNLICVLRDNLGKADAFITTAEALIVRSWSGDGDERDGDDEDGDGDDSVLQRRNQVEHLVEAAKLAVRAAGYTGQELKALTQRRRGA